MSYKNDKRRADIDKNIFFVKTRDSLSKKQEIRAHCIDKASLVCIKEIKKANKSERWMPRLWEAKKDVISCDKFRVGANNL